MEGKAYDNWNSMRFFPYISQVDLLCLQTTHACLLFLQITPAWYLLKDSLLLVISSDASNMQHISLDYLLLTCT